MNDAWVYLLRCADGTLYCGWARDVEARLAAHASGKGARYTRSRLPVELVWSRPMPDRGAAMREELRIKGLTREEKLALVAAGSSGAPLHPPAPRPTRRPRPGATFP